MSDSDDELSTSNEELNSPSDYLSMSDEDILNMTEPAPIQTPAGGFDDEDLDKEVSSNTDTEVIESVDEVKDSSTAEESAVEEVTVTDEGTEQINQNSSGVNYEEFYKSVVAPFKANGKEMTVTSVEDIKTLMQMGANYNKKMSALKPHLKIVRMLENNGLLDEGKLSFLIDLDKKDPAAVAKFLADKQIDPLDIDLQSSENYTPKTYNVSDTEVELKETLDSIRETPSYVRTLEVVNTKWDSASRKALLTNPSNIAIINDHIASGLYDHVMGIVENERILGRLNNMSDLDAYKHVGMQLSKQAPNKAPGNANSNAPIRKPVTSAADAVAQEELERKNKKLSAGSPTSKPSKAGSDSDFNPLAMPDAEFEKQFARN